MCLSNNLNPQRPVTFEDTILYGAEARDSQSGQIFHYLGYFNKVSVRNAGGDQTSVTSATSNTPIRRGSRGIPPFAPVPKQGRTQSASGGTEFGWDNLQLYPSRATPCFLPFRQ